MSAYDSLYGVLQSQINANNSWSAEQAQKQMDFQREMSNTSHQREIADLKAAGLNPILSANNGASTPNGAMGDVDQSATSAMVSLMNKMLDIEGYNAKANMIAVGNGSSSFGYGYGSDSGKTISDDKSVQFGLAMDKFLLMTVFRMNEKQADATINAMTNAIEYGKNLFNKGKDKLLSSYGIAPGTSLDQMYSDFKKGVGIVGNWTKDKFASVINSLKGFNNYSLNDAVEEDIAYYKNNNHADHNKQHKMIYVGSPKYVAQKKKENYWSSQNQKKIYSDTYRRVSSGSAKWLKYTK